jgi:membrane protein
MRWLPNVPWVEFFKRVYQKITETDVLSRAATVGFYFSFAFFPLLLCLVTIFGLVLGSSSGLKGQLYAYLAEIMPGSAYELVQKTMEEIIENSSGGKLTFGILITLWSASAGVDAVRGALNAVYEFKEERSWWYTKLQSLLLTLLFVLLIGIALALVTAGWSLFQVGLGYAGLQVSSPWVLSVVQVAAMAVVMILATAVIFSWLPCFDEFKWVWVSPGAIVAILLWVIFSGAFRTYLHFFNSYNKAYGSLGAVIILMLWMYLTGMAILIGGAINSVLTEMTDDKPDEPTA